MKKSISVFYTAVFLLTCTAAEAQLSINVSSASICQGAGSTTAYVTSSPTNAVTYTWTASSATCSGTSNTLSSSGATVSLSYSCCGLFTITCSAYDGLGALITSATETVNVLCAPSLSVSSTAPNGTLCSNRTATLIPSGASTYSWLTYQNPIDTLIVFPGCYTVVGTSNGCSSMLQTCISSVAVTSTVTIVPVGSTMVCYGGSTTLTATGATTYSWWSNPPYPGLPAISPSIVITPSTTTAFQALGVGGSQCPGQGLQVVFSYPLPTLSITATSTMIACGMVTPTLVATGSVVTYTWSTAQNGSSITVNPLATSCFSVIGTSVPGCTASASKCIAVNPAPLTITGGSSVCAGSSINLSTPPGSFTWNPGSLTGTLVSVSPPALTDFTVNGTLANGCAVTKTHSVNVVPLTAISISGSGSVCAGQPATLTASGASTYSWLPGGFTTNPLAISPLVNTTYSVYQTGPAPCPGSATMNVLVSPLPTLAASAMPASVTCGDGSTLSVAGNASSYSWTAGPATTSFVVSPLNSTCYTVTGASSAGCTDSSVVCVTVTPVPLNITGANTVCLGSSTDLTVTPAGIYTWNPGALSGTVVNVLPTAPVVYTINGSFTTGCISSDTFALTPDASCRIVWPGDANSDGMVNSSDVFEIGLSFNSTGAARSPASINWNGEHASVWTGTVSSGENRCHADCNGDGVINFSDTTAISTNFSSTHPFKQSSSAGGDLKIVAPAELHPGWNKVDIVLGDSTSSISLFGLAFDLLFDHQLVETGEADLKFPSSFVNASTQNVEFSKPVFVNGVVYAVSVRTDGQTVSGHGTIAQFWFRLKSDLPEGTDMNLFLVNGIKIDNQGVTSAVSAGTVSIEVSNEAEGISESGRPESLSVFPQPARETLYVKSSLSGPVTCTIVDLVGKPAFKQDFVYEATFDISGLSAGTYILIAGNGNTRICRKLLVID